MPLEDLNEAAAVPNRHLPIVGVRLHRLADAEHLRRDGLTADSAPGSSRLGQLGLELAIFVEDLSLSCLDVLNIGRQLFLTAPTSSLGPSGICTCTLLLAFGLALALA